MGNLFKFAPNTLLIYTAITVVNDKIFASLQEMPRITLDEMSGIKLMNRTDTKFLANKAQLLQVLALAREEYFVQEIGQTRISQYRTIYWDSPDYRFYQMHQVGHRPRTKVRVRTYEDSDGLTFLEVKKNNFNIKLEEFVTGADQLRMVDIVDDYLVPRNGIIYLTPHNKLGRAPFYSSEKILGSWHIKTLWFNLGVILLMSVIAIILLLTDCPGKFMRKEQ